MPRFLKHRAIVQLPKFLSFSLDFLFALVYVTLRASVVTYSLLCLFEKLRIDLIFP